MRRQDHGLIIGQKLNKWGRPPAALVGRYQISRLRNPEENAHAVVFLCGNNFVTGTTIHVDGGYAAQYVNSETTLQKKRVAVLLLNVLGMR